MSKALLLHCPPQYKSKLKISRINSFQCPCCSMHWSNGPQVPRFHQNKMFSAGTTPFLHGFYPWMMIISYTISSVLILRLSLYTLIDLFLGLNVHYSQYPSRTCIINNTHSPSFESLHPLVNSHWLIQLSPHWTIIPSQISLFCAPTDENLTRNRSSSVAYSIDGAAMLDMSRYNCYAKDNVN
jgi:hypothetical protein